MKRKILRNIFFGAAVILAAAAILPFGAVRTLIGQNQPAQANTALTNAFSISAKSITFRYPDGWSVGQPTLNSWVILNVPANQQDSAKPTVRVAISYLERTNHADAVNQLTE